MDPAVSLVEAYLQLNGYLTVTEFPIVTRDARGHGQSVTDVDVIAMRFPGARPLAAWNGERSDPDPDLGVRDGGLDLLITEVKEGKARLNPNLLQAKTLETVLLRVGCCPPEHVEHHVADLRRHGTAEMRHGEVQCRGRIALFSGRAGNRRTAALTITLSHVAHYLSQFLHDRRGLLRGSRLTQPALAHFALLDKLGVIGPHRSLPSAHATKGVP